MVPNTASPEIEEKRAEKLLRKGMIEEAAKALDSARLGYEKRGRSELSRKIALKGALIASFGKLSGALSDSELESVSLELDGVLGLCSTENEKVFVEYLKATVDIIRTRLKGQIEESNEATLKLESYLRQPSVSASEWYPVFREFQTWLLSDMYLGLAFVAYNKGDLVSYETQIGEARRLVEVMKQNSTEKWERHFVNGYTSHVDGLLPLLEGIRRASIFEFPKAVERLSDATQKFTNAEQKFARVPAHIPRGKTFALANHGYHRLAEAYSKAARADSKLFEGAPAQSLKLFRSASKDASEALSFLSKVGFLGAQLVGLAVRVREYSNMRSEVIRASSRENDTGKPSAMTLKPIFKGRDFLEEKKLCFVIIPFKDPFNRIYREGILPGLRLAGFRVVRADSIFKPKEAITESIWEFINRARLIVADVTGKNPNVFYELGLAHTVGKDAIIITQQKDDVPFDLRHLRFLSYADTNEGRKLLRENLENVASAVSKTRRREKVAS